MNIIRGGVYALGGLVGAGVLAWPAMADTQDSDVTYFKRDEQSVELVAVQDDDDDDTNDDNDDTGNTNTGLSNATNDNTASNFTKASRDRDVSRSDKTRDRTRDGGDRTRDWTAGATNDKSRNDTRARR